MSSDWHRNHQKARERNIGRSATICHASRYLPFLPLIRHFESDYAPLRLRFVYRRATRTELTGCRAAAAAAAAAAFIPAVGYILCQQRILLLPTPVVVAHRPPDAAAAAAAAGVLLLLLTLLLLLCLDLRGPAEVVELLLVLALA